jgi:long-chain acyl-CoA synthetase
VQEKALALRELGLGRGERLAILARTCLEWQIAEMAGLLAGGVIVGIEPHAASEQIAFTLEHAEASALVVENRSDLAKVPRAVLARLKFVVQLDHTPSEDIPVELVPWREMRPRARGPWSDRFPESNDPATLIYTAGTTGTPKGILYSHAQILAGCRAIHAAFPQLGEGDTTICWLPMAHLFQRMMNLVAMVAGVKTSFVEDPRRILEVIQETRPSVFIAVPRFYEKLQEGIHERLANLSGIRKRLLEEALAVGKRRSQASARGKVLSWRLRLWSAILDGLVGRQVRRVLGGKIKLLITGSAPSAPWLLEYLDAVGLRVLEAYGLSENTVPLAANRPDDYRFGSVGKPLSANLLRFAADGEILVQGPGVFGGYFKEERDPFTAEGFYPTGDYGRLDADGFLFLEGRKAEIIKTSTGRRLAPARIEAVYRQCAPVDQVVVFGEGRPHLVALVTLKSAGANALGEEASRVRALLQSAMDKVSSALAPYERVRAFALLPCALSIAAGELTPTLKLCRQRIAANHAALIERLYQAEEPPAPDPSSPQTPARAFTEVGS